MEAVAIILAAWIAAGAIVVWRLHVRNQRVLLGALLEQVRREGLSRVKYRPDQRLRACQQRLARIIGKKAYGKRWTKKLKAALGP